MDRKWGSKPVGFKDRPLVISACERPNLRSFRFLDCSLLKLAQTVIGLCYSIFSLFFRYVTSDSGYIIMVNDGSSSFLPPLVFVKLHNEYLVFLIIFVPTHYGLNNFVVGT